VPSAGDARAADAAAGRTAARHCHLGADHNGRWRTRPRFSAGRSSACSVASGRVRVRVRPMCVRDRSGARRLVVSSLSGLAWPRAPSSGAVVRIWWRVTRTGAAAAVRPRITWAPYRSADPGLVRKERRMLTRPRMGGGNMRARDTRSGVAMQRPPPPRPPARSLRAPGRERERRRRLPESARQPGGLRRKAERESSGVVPVPSLPTRPPDSTARSRRHEGGHADGTPRAPSARPSASPLPQGLAPQRPGRGMPASHGAVSKTTQTATAVDFK